MTCTSCGAQNDPGRKFCLECGAPLAVVCGACGAGNPAAAKFCGECGGRLDAAVGSTGRPVHARVAAPSPAPVVAERRLVSVLFADMVGFTALAEHRDAEEVRDLLSRYFDRGRLLEAYDELREIGAARRQALGGLVMATLLDAGEPRVRAAIEESRRLFERMGANLWLVLLDRALAAGRPVAADPVRSTEIGDAIPR